MHPGPVSHGPWPSGASISVVLASLQRATAFYFVSSGGSVLFNFSIVTNDLNIKLYEIQVRAFHLYMRK
jgi:hypothetical protein